MMAAWKAWTRRATDDELRCTMAEVTAGSRRWCFVESPTCSDFLDEDDACARLGTAWLVRMFGRDGEIAARRTGFDSERPWLVRVIGRHAPDPSGWQVHELGDGKEQALVLYGVPDGSGGFVEGTQFRDPFRYPDVAAQDDGDRATLLVCLHPAGEGKPVARWVALQAASSRRT